MKLIKLVTLITLLISSIQLFSQCTDVPDELYRGRLKAPGGAYGHPYTMFDRRKPYGKDFLAWDELGKIRTAIIYNYNMSVNSEDKGVLWKAPLFVVLCAGQ